MTWNPDAPLELLNRASLVYVELMGHAAYCNWLEQELPRVKIYLNFKSSVIFSASTEGGARGSSLPSLAATGAAAIDPHLVDEMVDVLRWYADGKNYRDERHGDPIPVLVDDGSRAAHMLALYAKHEAGENVST